MKLSLDIRFIFYTEKLQQKAMSVLRELPAFQTFMRKNSFLSSIFLTENPTDINDPSLAGLQRRTVVEAQIQNQIAGGGPNAQNMVQQNIQNFLHFHIEQ